MYINLLLVHLKVIDSSVVGKICSNWTFIVSYVSKQHISGTFFKVCRLIKRYMGITDSLMIDGGVVNAAQVIV